jgi:hypothetical protein
MPALFGMVPFFLPGWGIAINPAAPMQSGGFNRAVAQSRILTLRQLAMVI